MTTVAWDGLTLAADRQCTNGNATFQVCKVSQCDRDGGYMLAFSGDADQGEEMVNWFTSGADPDKFPEKQRETNRFSPLVAIRES